MKQNLVKQKIRRGEPTIGTWLSLASVIAAERMALAGFDWLTIDLEHAPTNWETAMAMVAVVGAQGCAPLGPGAELIGREHQAGARPGRHGRCGADGDQPGAGAGRRRVVQVPAARCAQPRRRPQRRGLGHGLANLLQARERRDLRVHPDREPVIPSTTPRRSWPCRASTARSSGRRI